MNGRLTARLRGFVAGSVLAIFPAGATARSQADSSDVLHATLRGWEDNARMTIFDRGGSFNGRLSDRGILQRFNEQLDHEYAIDRLSFAYTLSEDYQWYSNRRGARLSGGSINHRNLVYEAELGGTVSLGRTWGFDVLFDQQWTLQANRALVRTRFRKSFADDKAVAFATGWLNADKPEMDFELGLSLLPGRGRITAAFAALDVFNDLIYQRLGIGPPVARSSLDYLKHPFTLRTAADVWLGKRFRLEVFGLYMIPSELIVTFLPSPEGSFRQEERYGYAGGLLEWAPSRRTAVGVFGTYVGAGLNRASADPPPAEDDFHLTERTGQVGAYLIQRVLGRFVTEARVIRVLRTEDRLPSDPSIAPAIDYEDRTWLGRGSIIYRSATGLRLEIGFDFALLDTFGTGDLPGDQLDGNNTRLRFDLGWYFGRSAMFVLGWKADLDGDRNVSDAALDGAQGRFQVFW